MLNPALSSSTLNPLQSAFSSPAPATPSGPASSAPDGFARLLDKASKADAPSPNANANANASTGPAPADGTTGKPNSAGADLDSGDGHLAPWQPGPTPMPGPTEPPSQRLIVAPAPGHKPVRLPPVPAIGGPAPASPDTLGLAAAAGDIGNAVRADRGDGADPLSGDRAAADPATATLLSINTPPPPLTPMAFDASALLAAWNPAAAAAGAPGPQALAGAEAGAASASHTATDHTAIAARATTALPLAASLAAAGAARGTPSAAALAPAAQPAADAALGTQPAHAEPAAAEASDRSLPATAASASATATATAAVRLTPASVEPPRVGATGSTERRSATPAAAQPAGAAATRAAAPLAGATPEASAAALEAGNRYGGAASGLTTAPADATRRSARSEAPGAVRADSAIEPSTSLTGDLAPGEVVASTAFSADTHATANAPERSTVAAAPATATVAAAALAQAREGSGSLLRSVAADKVGTVAAAAAMASAGGTPWPSAMAWASAATAGMPAATPTDGRIAASPSHADFAPQLAAHITTFVRDGLQQARLELNPGEMGPLTVQIQLDGNAARVHLAAEHAGTRAALEQAMPQLAGSLRENGLTLSGGGVFEQPRQPQQQAQSGGGNGNGNGANNGNDNPRDSRRDGARDAAANGQTGTAGAPGRRHAGVVDLVA